VRRTWYRYDVRVLVGYAIRACAQERLRYFLGARIRHSCSERLDGVRGFASITMVVVGYATTAERAYRSSVRIRLGRTPP
jgi:hypothetical protein